MAPIRWSTLGNYKRWMIGPPQDLGKQSAISQNVGWANPVQLVQESLARGWTAKENQPEGHGHRFNTDSMPAKLFSAQEVNMRMCIAFFVGLVLLLDGELLRAQEPTPVAASNEAPSLKVEIADEPRAIDPATLMPPELAQRVTHTFEQTSLRDLITWLRTEQKLTVIVDTAALTEQNILINEQLHEELHDEPVYLLLDRLRTLGLSWYIADGNLFLTTLEKVELHRVTVPYNVGDLLDIGYEDASLMSTIEQETTGPWDADEPGTGTIVMLGDVLFVRQTAAVQREVGGLLAALRKPARRTLLLDCPQHAALREKLNQRISVNFAETPFDEAVRELARLAETTIRIDRSLSEAGVRMRQPITFSANEQTLGTIMQSLVIGAPLAPSLRDGQIWISSKESLDEKRHTAVLDVRDLCRNNDESAALINAVVSQTRGPWDQNEPGTGTLSCPLPGTLVVRQTMEQLDAVSELLENYRTALRASKPRKPRVPDPQEVSTRYYRMPTEMATDLADTLPLLIGAGSWKIAEALDQPGELRITASKPELEVANFVVPGKAGPAANPQVGSVPYSVLIIKQTRENHHQIVELIRNVQYGNASMPDDFPRSGGGGKRNPGQGGGGAMRGGGGGQQGGFGGGVFQVEP